MRSWPWSGNTAVKHEIFACVFSRNFAVELRPQKLCPRTFWLTNLRFLLTANDLYLTWHSENDSSAQLGNFLVQTWKQILHKPVKWTHLGSSCSRVNKEIFKLHTALLFFFCCVRFGRGVCYKYSLIPPFYFYLYLIPSLPLPDTFLTFTWYASSGDSGLV